MRFLSAEPHVRLTKAFTTPYRNVVATARTCYSSRGIIEDNDVGEPERFSPLARSIYEAGHHTTFQHAHFQFALENVSRQFLWSFLHAHPFYNSEQVSQRYVTVKPDTMTVPELPTEQLTLYRECIDIAFEAYRRLGQMLEAPARSQFFQRFNPSERMRKQHDRAIGRKAQEAARYVLPLATHAYLYHTISGITLLRYYRLCNQHDVPAEQRLVATRMVEELLAIDPEYQITLEQPLEEDALPENAFLQQHPAVMQGRHARDFRNEFDAELEGMTSKLAAWPAHGERLLADSVREVLGLPRAQMPDDDAIRLALDPSVNTILGESMNLTTHHKISRAMAHIHFTFRKRLSHTADSQDQRHRMTPGSRPILAAQFDDQPDYITPELVRIDDTANAFYRETMQRMWDKIATLRRIGATTEVLTYLLPNAVTIRFTESADLLNLRHKHQMRLCYNAQEEIWHASVDEARQIRQRLPRIGAYLLPPCGIRQLARKKPICPEGPRYCGIRVWKLDLEQYQRVI